MKRLIILLLGVLLLAGVLSIPTSAGKNPEFSETINIIILTEGETDSLVKFIQSIGGTVNIQYKNVPAVAASVSLNGKAMVAGFPGVVKIEKDLSFSLDDHSGEKPRSFVVEDTSGIEIKSLEISSVDFKTIPEGYSNFLLTGAYFTWSDTYAGDGSVVAVVDTGTVPNVCLSHAVIGAPGYPDGYNASGDGIPATDPLNYWHGTHVAGVIASACALDFSADPEHPVFLAQQPYLGWPVDFVPIFGQAPDAEIYPVKVGDVDGGLMTSWIFDGLDHIISLKKSGDLDIDIVNMSLGGGTQWDGRDIFDRFVEAIQDNGMLLVASASNDGPVPNSIGSPATSFAALSVGALDYPENSRVLYEYLGLAVWPGAPGMGMVMRPTDDVRVADFSSRGPVSDGRIGPEIQALGSWNFAAGTTPGSLRWAGGTSFSAPTVAGAAALLNAYWEHEMGGDMDPITLENVLLKGANPNVVAPTWRNMNDQGYGAVDVPASLAYVMDGDFKIPSKLKIGLLKANVLGEPKNGKTETWESNKITLAPNETFDAVFKVNSFTSKVYIEVFDIATPDNSAYAFWPNALVIHLQGAKRSGIEHPINVYWYPYFYGDTATIDVEDGLWTFAGEPWDYYPMEPGLMKLTLVGDVSNESSVSFKVRIVRENLKEQSGNRIDNSQLKTGEFNIIPVDIPEGTTTATFDLVWHRDWSKFPTADLDLLVFDPYFAVASVDGATWNAPERAVITDPMAGTWYLVVDGFELYGFPDNYDLFMTLESAD